MFHKKYVYQKIIVHYFIFGILKKSIKIQKNIGEELSKNTNKKFVNHLWYLASKNIVLAFFNKHISHETKILMVKMLKNNANKNVDTDKNNTIINKLVQLNVNEVSIFINNYLIEDWI